MEMHEIIAKVNHYSAIAKQRELTHEEKVEREKFRKMYLELFKAQVKGHLDSIKIVDNEEINSEKII